MKKKDDFYSGLKSGIPIALGYFPVAFTFGIVASSMGVPWYIATLISLTNLTSAGQFAGIILFNLENAYIEIALSQFIINLRYSLMSLSLSQKIDTSWRLVDRILLSFGITDEIFAVSISKDEKISRYFFLSLMILPIIGWSSGTLVGSFISSLIDQKLQNALGLAIYSMFLAIIIPQFKKSRAIAFTIILAALLSILLTYLNGYLHIGSGFITIIVIVVTALIASILRPIEEAR